MEEHRKINIEEREKVENAAAQAVKVIAEAAQEATKTIAAAASDAAARNEKGLCDHDLLIELKTRMEGLKNDIQNLNNGTTIQIADHEKRIFALQESRGKQNLVISLGIAIQGILISLLVYHMFKVG